MARKVFYSFHYGKDAWRASQVRNIGKFEGNSPVSANQWEEVKQKGDNTIKKWINDNLFGKSCLILLIGEETYSRKWCKYEIKRAWEEGKGVVGIYIHGLKNANGEQCSKGINPFESFCIDRTMNYIVENRTPADKNEINLSKICNAYNPPYMTSKYVYDDISEKIEALVEDAIRIRNQYPK